LPIADCRLENIQPESRLEGFFPKPFRVEELLKEMEGIGERM
jgi:hypothetical protein